jgi:hypothetical protein
MYLVSLHVLVYNKVEDICSVKTEEVCRDSGESSSVWLSTYPRFTVIFLKGPFSIHPPPLPAGFIPLLECVTLAPCPLMLVSLPSKMGEVSGLEAHLPQSQYFA